MTRAGLFSLLAGDAVPELVFAGRWASGMVSWSDPSDALSMCSGSYMCLLGSTHDSLNSWEIPDVN